MERYFKHPAEVWDHAKCERAVKHLARDGRGTPYPGKGFFPYIRSGKVRYNGGTIRDGDWYAGDEFFLPQLAEGFVWVYVPTWCYRIQRVGEKGKN